MAKKKRYKGKKEIVKKEKKMEAEVRELSADEKAREQIKNRIDKEGAFFIYWPSGDVTWYGLPDKDKWVGFVQNHIYQDFNNPVFSNLFRHIFGAKAEDTGKDILAARAARAAQPVQAQIPASATLVDEDPEEVGDEVIEALEEVDEVVEEDVDEEVEPCEKDCDECEDSSDCEDCDNCDDEEVDAELAEYERLKAKFGQD